VDFGQCDVPPGYVWSTVSVSKYHSCGLTAKGQAVCWGGVRSTPNPQPSTLNPQPYTLNPHSSTLDLSLHRRRSTLNPEPSTLNPQPSTLNPQPSTLNSTPCTLNSQPYILNPTPSTLHPKQVGDFAVLRAVGVSCRAGRFPGIDLTLPLSHTQIHADTLILSHTHTRTPTHPGTEIYLALSLFLSYTHTLTH
jgi:hypothetical protein